MSTKMSPRCDICNYRDGHKGLGMVKCKVCDLSVHENCYGTVTQEQSRNDFTCFACNAVGRNFEAVETHLGTEVVTLCQGERPSRCALCSVSGGVHAMHPLYDYHGIGGRQICRKVNGQMELVWAHSLCAYYLSLQGLLYGCSIDGSYADVMEDIENDTYEEEDDNRPPNPELISRIEDVSEFYESHYGLDATHHFRYYLLRESEIVHNRDVLLCRYTKAVEDHKKHAKCTICGLDDKSDPMTMRIPVQCVANDKDEFPEFKGKHPSLQPGIPCFEALHVGCGRWGGNPTNIQRVYFFPGLEEKGVSIDPVTCLFCTLHAQDVDPKYKKRLREQKTADQPDQFSNQASMIANQKAISAKLQNTNLAMAGNHRIGQVVVPSAAISARSGNMANDHVAVIDQRPSITRSHGESTTRKHPKRKSVEATFSLDIDSQAMITPKKSKMVSEKALCGSAVVNVGFGNRSSTIIADRQARNRGWYGASKARDRYAELDSAQALAVNIGPQPTLARSRRELAAQKSIVNDSKVEQILQDLVQHAENECEPAKEESVLRLTLTGRKRYWKHKFSELSTHDFNSVWQKAKESFKQSQDGGYEKYKKLNSNDVPESLLLGNVPSESATHCNGVLGDLNDMFKLDEGGNTEKMIYTSDSRRLSNDVNSIKIEAGDGRGEGCPPGKSGQIEIVAATGQQPKGQIKTRSEPDPWFNLFVGPTFTGEEFKLEVEYPDTISI